MSGIDPTRFMQDVAGRLDGLDDRTEIETLLDELEYLMEVLDPEQQEPGHELAERLRGKLDEPE